MGKHRSQESGTKRKDRDGADEHSPKTRAGREKREKRRKTKVQEVEKEEDIKIFVHEEKDDKPLAVDTSLESESDSDDDEELDWDPEVSYVGKKLDTEDEPEATEGDEAKPKRTRWIKKGLPIMSRDQIPKEWNWSSEEPDLSRHDIDGRIERNKERIADGVLPWQFKPRLEEYENLKLIRDQLMDRYPGKSYEVAQRLDDLTKISKHLLVEGDEFGQLANARALLDHYKTGKLQWNEGLVTYWSHGKQLCQPRPFSWDEFFRVNKKHKGHHSFWVEGFNHPGPANRFLHTRRFPGPAYPLDVVMTTFSIKHPLQSAEASIDIAVADDTGSSFLAIRRTDITDLQDACVAAGHRRPRIPPVMGVLTVTLADNRTMVSNVISMRVNVEDDAGNFILPHHDAIQCIVDPKPPAGAPATMRLGGPWLRERLFTATLPDESRDLWAFDVRSEFTNVRSVAPNYVTRNLDDRPLPFTARLRGIGNRSARDY